MASAVPGRAFWALLLGFSLWSAAFVAIYGLQAIGCYAGWNAVAVGPMSLHRLLLGASFFATLAALWLLGRWQRAWLRPQGVPPEPFLRWTGDWLTVLALIASVFVFAPVLVLDTCL